VWQRFKVIGCMSRSNFQNAYGAPRRIANGLVVPDCL